MNIDANRSYVGLADNGTIATPIKVDATSGRLLVDIVGIVSSTPHTTSKIDENRTGASTVFDGTIQRPLLVDSSGNLIIDLNIE